MIKAIIFDCFGVLTTDTWRAFVDTLPPDIDIVKARELNRQYGAGFLTKDEFLEQVQAVTGRKPEQVEEMIDNEVVKNTALLDYIRELKKEYKIGMISNVASSWIRESFLTAEERSLFDEMIFSFEIGITKPDPRIFALACERLHVAPAETVLVDDVASYCEAARGVGMKAVEYHGLNEFKKGLQQFLYLQ